MKQETVHIYVSDSVSDWEYSYAAAGINNPQLQVNPGRYRISTAALKKSPITAIEQSTPIRP